ncbi:hypothetical protein H072_1620 [Dactylellina haptotyla CBS 200.50]|uniref:Uncharacterized protein n=1 Tax=Dactylellina haptotyla (strain CBS 200.50) TaxID=1284197 RepID=S8AN87_DACHA|nr:hypothetical protein H072_1620 [Dactylellina haptotyla CBS 200.50]
MAPRRGGSSGGSGSINNQCSDYDAFESDYAKAQIGLMGGFLFLFLVLAYCTASRSGKRKKSHQTKSILRWYQYGLALFLILALFIMLIVRYSLVECGVLYSYGEDSTAIGVATVVVNNVVELFMLGLILFVINLRILELAGSTSIRRVLNILGAIFFAIVCVIWAAYIILYGLISYDVGRTTTRSSLLAYSRLVQAYVIIWLLLAIFAVVGSVFAWIRLARKPERKKGITGWIPVMIICLLGYAFYNVVVVFLAYYDSSYGYDRISNLAGYGVSLLFFFGVFFAIFMISRAPGWDWLGSEGPAMQDAYTFSTTTNVQPTGYGQTAYDPMNDPSKRMSHASHMSPTSPAPPYGNTMPYSGNGVYEPQGQTYSSGNWGSGGYSQVHQMPTAYNAPMGAASRDAEHNELTGGR